MVLKVGSLNNKTTLVTFKPWHCPWCELTCPEFSPEVRIAQGCSAEDQKVLPPPLQVQSSSFWQKVIHIHLTFDWGAGTISWSSKEHIWTNSTADLPQAFSKETGSVITPGSGVWAKLRGRREAANRAEKGRCPAQSAPSVTAEQGGFFQAVPRIKALKAELPSLWVRSWAELGDTESQTKGKTGATMQSHPKAQNDSSWRPSPSSRGWIGWRWTISSDEPEVPSQYNAFTKKILFLMEGTLLGSILARYHWGSYLYKEGLMSVGRVKVGEGNGTPLQYSCLGNPMNGGAW